MFVMIDYKSRLPIYEQIYNGIIETAALGAYDENEQLPSTRALASELGINPNTVMKAYGMLERDGIIVTIPGKGSFITEKSAAVSLKKEMLFSAFREKAEEAKNCGIEKKELKDILNLIYGED